MAERHALIIGIDRYPLLDAQYQLAGCVNDARLMASVLQERFGFPASNVRSLHDAEASRDAILAGMEHLVQVAGADDEVFFHFSGHGSRRTSVDASESSGKDSTLMPSDSGRNPHPNRDIVDDEIGAWLDRLAARTRRISLLIDCCHSGTITRDPFAARIRAAPADERALDEMGVGAPTPPGPARRALDPASDWLALGESWVVMSGCRDTEYAHEFSERRGGEIIRHGALTHFLVSALLAAPPGSRYRDVFEKARREVSTRFPTQHPQIEGARDRELFSDARHAAGRYVELESEQNGEIILKGGAAHGLAPGALWAVVPPPADLAQTPPPIARLEITRVDVLRAFARRLEQGPPLPAGARCIEQQPSTAQFRPGVDLQALPADDAATLRPALSDSPLLRITDSADEADYRVERVASTGEAPSGPVWRVIDRSGGPIASPVPCDEADAPTRLRGQLETWARFRNALLIDNPCSRLNVEFRLLRERDGGWQRMADDEDLVQGDSIAFELVNHTDAPVFVSVLDFGLTGRIQLLYPPNSSSEQLAPGRTLRIGADRRRIRLGLPEGFAGDHGHETFKAFITEDETDFSWLQQVGTRSFADATTGLRRLFAAAIDGPSTRDALLEPETEADGVMKDWCAIGRRFVLRRRAD
ncbi:caspase family protein [Pseudomarimonas salicorniae]|uniref:Caspase family protein n=1 Tax=Pseudomarimonas salicorniae TaxID=2933270 RepID=A0ABT0GKA8_9GAMM|nr:caspase family protein [Lysobacter sp. CAU 1642]MCK7594644.1 caspase family protein [Lysobacter sp. CAU 1642]